MPDDAEPIPATATASEAAAREAPAPADNSGARKPAVIMRAADIEARAIDFVHPWSAASSLRGSFLGTPAGLRRSGVNLIRIAAGKESFPYHAHLHEEEWLYVIAGRAIIECNDDVHELAAGDFVAFPTPSQPHQVRNPFEQDVVYLTGGEAAALDVVDFPRLGKRSVRIGGRASVYRLEDGAKFPFPGIDEL